jgi:hypothetical protein
MNYAIIGGAVLLLIIIVVFIMSKKKQPLPSNETTTQANVSPTPPSEPTIELPSCSYPPFDHARLLEMGLGNEEAKEFVGDLIPEIESHLSDIDRLINEGKYQELERVVHGIKGAANNVGTGGVSTLLTELNNYLRGDTIEEVVLLHYATHLKSYTETLKSTYA